MLKVAILKHIGADEPVVACKLVHYCVGVPLITMAFLNDTSYVFTKEEIQAFATQLLELVQE